MIELKDAIKKVDELKVNAEGGMYDRKKSMRWLKEVSEYLTHLKNAQEEAPKNGFKKL